MTIAALQAVALRRHLERHRRLRARRFAQELAKVVRPPWQMATGADLVFPGVERRRTRAQRLLGAYVTRIHATAAHDPDVARAFVRVSGLVDGPQALLRPSTVWRVLRPGQPTTARPGPSGAPAGASTPPWRSRC